MKRILFIACLGLTLAFCNTPEPATTDTPNNTGTTGDTTGTGNRTDTGARRSDTLRLQ